MATSKNISYLTISENLCHLQHSLEPYVTNRRDARNLRLYLASQFSFQQDTFCKPLSLAEPSNPVEHDQVKCALYREYWRALQYNRNAKSDFALLSTAFDPKLGSQVASHDYSISKPKVSSLVQKKVKRDRLRVTQEHIQGLTHESPHMTWSDKHDGQVDGIESLPSMPLALLDNVTNHRVPIAGAENVLDRLEKSVLCAKIGLKREQKLMLSVQRRYTHHHPASGPFPRSTALASTRNDLITWIENELLQTNENPSDRIKDYDNPKVGSTQSQLHISQLHYSRYVSSRQDLIRATDFNDRALDNEGITSSVDNRKHLCQEQPHNLDASAPILSAILDDMTVLYSEQKTAVQEKSLTSIVLSKHLKTTAQLLDRLVDESHILRNQPPTPGVSLQVPPPSYSKSFAEDMATSETPDVSRRVQAWTFASASAHSSNRKFISEKLEEGGNALLAAQEGLLELLEFLGNECDSDEGMDKSLSLTWAGLDGRLGVI